MKDQKRVSGPPAGPVPAVRARRTFNDYVHDSGHPEKFLVVKPRGTRDLHAAFLRLALGQRDTPKKDTLWLSAPSLTSSRVLFEWHRFKDVIAEPLTKRLKLVALVGPDFIADPSLSKRDEVAARAYLVARVRQSPIPGDLEHSPPTRKFFEVWKVLVNAWYSREGPLALQELARRSGTSAPTLAQALERLRRRGELPPSRNRPVGLEVFPRTTLREVVALSESLRRPLYYVDASGRDHDPLRLLHALTKRPPKGVALGGVSAARVFDPKFDLNGLPRVDVVASSAAGDGWVKDLDPALRLATPNAGSPMLVVHPVLSMQQNAGPPDIQSVPLADYAETLLDLFELRLTDQAEAMIRLRQGPDA